MKIDADLLRIDVEEFSCDSKFYTRCYVNDVNDRVCSLRIDNRCCRNFVSTLVVEKLSLDTLNLQNPYKLQLTEGYEEIQVNDRVLLSISIGKYKEEVWCDVVPMESCHILLGHPWYVERKAKIDETKNRCSLVQDRKQVHLKLLNSLQVYGDLLQLQNSFAKHKEKTREKSEEIECETLESCEMQTLESDIFVSTNEISFPSDPNLQESKDKICQDIPDGVEPQSEFIPCDLEESKNEDSRTNLFKEGGNDMILEASSLILINFKFNNPYQGYENLLTGVIVIILQVKWKEEAYKVIWDTKD